MEAVNNNCLPLGKLIELVGDEDSGKTFYALDILNKNSNYGNIGVYINIDKTISNNTYLNKNVIIINESKSKNIITILNELLKTNAINLIVVDSLPLLNENIQTIKNFIKEITRLTAKYNITSILVNQYRYFNGREVPFLNNILKRYSSMTINTTNNIEEKSIYVSYKSYKMKIKNNNKIIYY